MTADRYLITHVLGASRQSKFIEKYKGRINVIVETRRDGISNYILSFDDSKIELLFQLSFDQSPLPVPEIIRTWSTLYDRRYI
jgi:hypothetical protein